MPGITDLLINSRIARCRHQEGRGAFFGWQKAPAKPGIPLAQLEVAKDIPDIGENFEEVSKQ